MAMRACPVSFVFPSLATVVLACVSSAAWAASDTQVVQQVLDRVAVFNGGTALEMNFERKPYKEPTADEPNPAVLDFYNYNLVESARLGNCRLNGSRGLYCVDGQGVRRWQDPADGGSGHVEFSCANEALRLDKNRTDICTALAVAQSGDVWVAGRRKNASVLIRLRQKLNGSCRDATEQSLLPAASERYCYLEYTTSERPLISRLLVIENEEGDVFDRGNGVPADGVLALDVRDVVTYYSMVPKAVPVDLVTRSGWLLDNKEVLQDLALLQTANGNTIENRLLVTTSNGRVLSRQTDAGAPLVTPEVFNVPFERVAAGSATCPVAAAAPAGYGITVSAKTGRVYVTDRSYCQVLALDPFDKNGNAADGIQFGGLVNVKDTSVVGDSDLTLSTSNSSVPSGYDGDTVNITGEYPPDGATVAPGIVVNLKECKGTCKVITSAEADLLTLTAVQLNSAQSSIVLFQIRNIPDCRYVPAADPNDPDAEPNAKLCALHPGAVIGPPNEPGQQYLDVAQLLPPEVTAQFPSTNSLPPGLPPLLISPLYRGQADKGYLFGAVFAIPEPGVVFKETFEADFDVAGLTGGELGCQVTDYPDTTVLQDLLRWDVVTRVSERYIAPGGPNGLAATVLDPEDGSPMPNKLRYVDTIVNSGCGTTKTKIGSFSLIAYDLEIAHNPTVADDQDDVFARLVVKLFDDLQLTQSQLACPSGVDRAATSTLPASDPLTDAQCATLNSVLLNAQDKLNKCVAATRQPKTSAVDQNCQAFETQFSSYRSQLGAVPAASATLDPANRIGELKARAETLWLVYGERFLPSVPLGGYTPLPQ
jgi:hypothetical protein